MRDASFVLLNAFLRATFNSSGVFTKYPQPPNASMIFSYRADGSRAVGGALNKVKYKHIFISCKCQNLYIHNEGHMLFKYT